MAYICEALYPGASEVTEVIPCHATRVIPCNAENKMEIIFQVADMVSRIFSEYPKRDVRETLLQRGVQVNATYPSASEAECENFREALKAKIVEGLSQDHWARCSVKLSTNYCPEGVLYEVAKPIFARHENLGLLFPYKTFTWISFTEGFKELRIDWNRR